MLSEKQLNDYKKDIDSQLRKAQEDLELAKANLHAVIGAQQAMAHIMSLNQAKEADPEDAD